MSPEYLEETRKFLLGSRYWGVSLSQRKRSGLSIELLHYTGKLSDSCWKCAPKRPCLRGKIPVRE